MSNSTQTTVTPLTSTQQNLMMDEIEKIEQRLKQLYKDLQTTQQDFQDLVEIAKDMKNSQGTDAIFVRDVKEAQKCLQKIKDIEGWIDRGLSEADFQTEIIQNLIYFPTVTMDDDFRAAVLRAPQPYRYNIVQMYLKGHRNWTENLTLLVRNQNNVQNAIKARQPSELEKLTAELKARLEKIGLTAIKNVQEELQTMYKYSRDVNKIKRKDAEAHIPGLIETLKVHQRMCELSIQAFVKKLSLQVTNVQDVEEHLKYELEELNRIQSQGMMGRVPIVQAKVTDLKKLKELMIEKELTDKVLEGPEPEPFYQLPNWKEEIYARQPFAKRVEMLDELLQKNQFIDYSELLTKETEIEGSTEFTILIRLTTPKITTCQWENVSSLLYQYFIRGNLSAHSAMKIYYQQQLKPIFDPLDMRDAHEILKEITIPEDCSVEYQMILDQFPKSPISTTLNEVKTLSHTNQAFATKIEQALQIVLTPSNRTLRQILQGYDHSLGARSSFQVLKDGLLSLQDTGRQRALQAFMELERENSQMPQLAGLKDILKKYIPDFDQKAATEVTRLMIEKIDEKFANLEKRVQSKNYNDLIEDLKLLEPSELTPTVQSALHYYQKCNALILAFRQTLANQSQECMTDLSKNLARSSEDFSHSLSSFQKSLVQEENFSQVLPGLEQKLLALNIQKGLMLQSQSFTQQNSIIQAFAEELDSYIGSLSGLPVFDEKWTQCLLKLCILSAQFPGEFDAFRRRLIDQYSNMIEFGLRKSYRVIIENKNILGSFQEENQQGPAGPALAFQSLMRSISQVQANIETLLKKNIAAALKELDMIVNQLIGDIASSISKDLMIILDPQVTLLISGNYSTSLAPERANLENETIKTALNLIGNFAQSANESKLQAILQALNDLYDSKVQNLKDNFQECKDSFCSHLQPQVSSDLMILDNTDIKKDYEKVLSLRQVPQVRDATAKNFIDLQRQVKETLIKRTSSIIESMRELEQGTHRRKLRSECIEFFRKITQQVDEFKYFSAILEIDLPMKEQYIRNIQSTFESCMTEMYIKIELKHVASPKEWEKISKVAIIVDEYEQIKDIFAKINIHTNESQNQNVRAGFDRAVCKAMNTIQASLSEPIQFMTSDHYQEFAIYLKYLDIIQQKKQMYIPKQQQQDLAERMSNHINYLRDRQLDQLEKTFEYFFRRYLFSENKEPDKFRILKKPSPIQFSVEENKSEISSQEEYDSQSLDQSIFTACQEVKNIVKVPYWLIQRQINEDTRNSEIDDPLRDLLNELIFEKIVQLYQHFKKSLLYILFEGFDIKTERLNYESERESSLFNFKLQIVKQLGQLDQYFDMTSEEADTKELKPSEKSKYKELFKTMKHEEYIYLKMSSAIQEFNSVRQSNVIEEATIVFKQLYEKQKFKKLSEELKLKEGVGSIKIDMTSFIINEIFKIKNSLEFKIQAFDKSADKVKEICHLILHLDAIAQFLEDYVNVQDIDIYIKNAIDAIQYVFHDSFKSIDEQCDIFQFNQAIKQLYKIHVLIQKMATFYADSTQVDSFPNKRNSLAHFFEINRKEIYQIKTQINDRLKKTFSDYKAIITNGRAQLEQIQQEKGYSAKLIINSIKLLEAKEIEWAETETLENSFDQGVINKFNIALDQIKVDKIIAQEELDQVTYQLYNLKETLIFLPDSLSSTLQKLIEAKNACVLFQKEIIQKNSIDSAFLSQDADVISNVIKANSNIINDRLIETFKDKFYDIIKPICENGERIICAEQVEPYKLLEFMRDQVFKILQFLNNDDLRLYIDRRPHDFYQKSVKSNLRNLHQYILCYIQRRIELGSKPFKKFEIAFQIKRDENIQIEITFQDTDDALDLIDHINQASIRKQVIDGYDSRLMKFFKACSEHFYQLIFQLQEAIRKNEIATILILVDDIAFDEKFVSQNKFIKAFVINYQEENKNDFEFVQAVNVLRGQEPKKQLHQWGKERHLELKKIDFSQNTNQKRSKHERSNYYGKYIVSYKELEEVAIKTSAYDFYDYQGEKLRKYHESAQNDVGEKVQRMRDSFCDVVEKNLSIGEGRDLLSMKEAREINDYFNQIYSGFQNLESICEHFTIIDPQMKKEIEEDCLKQFKEQIDQRINKIKDAAKRCSSKDPKNSEQFIDLEDLMKIARILIEIQLMKSNFTKFKEDIQKFQDAIIDEYELIQEQKKNKGSLDNLIRLIQKQDYGAQIMDECQAFNGHQIIELAKKLNTKTVHQVLQQISGQDIDVIDDEIKLDDNFKEDKEKFSKAKELLLYYYNKYYQIYKDKLINLTTVKHDDDKPINLEIDLQSIVKEIKDIEMDKQKWNDKNIENIPNLLALIFTLWSLQKPEELQKQQKNHRKLIQEDKEKLKQSQREELKYSESEELKQSDSKELNQSESEEIKQSESEELKQSLSEELNQSESDKLDQSETENEKQMKSETQPVNFLCYLKQPHPAQILGIMRILGVGYDPDEQVVNEKQSGITSRKIRNNLVQIKTGEGKSVTLAVLSIIFALCDFDVSCACYSDYLSQRDFKAFDAMFDLLDLKKQIIYNTFNEICELEIKNSGDPRQIMQNLLLKKSEKVQITSNSKHRPRILLIDEADVFFSESFFGKTYMPQTQIKEPEVQALTDFIWENRDEGLTFEKVSVTQQYLDVLALFQDEFEFLLIESVKQMLVDLQDVPKFKLGVKVEGIPLMDIIDCCIKYKVGDSWTPNVRDSYRTMFAYYYYFNNPQPGKDSIQINTLKEYKAIGINFTQLSYAEIPLSFTMILGVTGTLDTLSVEQQKIMRQVYNFISKTYAPSVYDVPKEQEIDKKHQKNKKQNINKIDGLKEEILIMNEAQEIEHKGKVNNAEIEVVNEMQVKIINGSRDQWFQELTKKILQLIITKNSNDKNKENQRAVIVFFQTEEILNDFLQSKHFDQLKSYNFGVLTDKLENDERDSMVKNATIQGQITLSTREFGRGTDFKYHGDAVINAGGLAVIQAFFTFDYSEEIQIRGRTRRQGTTGSYEIYVYLEDLYQLLGNEDTFVESLIGLSQREIYNRLHYKGLEAYEMKQKSKMQTRIDLKPKHDYFMNQLEIIKRSVKGEIIQLDEFESVVSMLKELNTCHNYDIIFNQKKRCIKTLVLIDATGSMGDLLKNVQDIILQYFEDVCQSLKKSKYNQDLFKIQIAFYRNYCDGENILKVSPWVGPNEQSTIKNFVDQEQASGGTRISRNEAMEIAFQHANKEIYSPTDGEPVSLIFVIGDVPSNTKQEILRLKYKVPVSVNSSMTDEEARSKYGYKEEGWNESLQAQYGESTTWDAQLDKIKKFEDEDGFKISVQSFYVSNSINSDLEQFYYKLRVNNSLEDRGRLLNLSHSESLLLSMCVYTMKMIADKNPQGGNRDQLQSLAREMHERQLAFA